MSRISRTASHLYTSSPRLLVGSGLLLLMITTFACRGTKNLTEGQKLFTGHDISIEAENDVPKQRQKVWALEDNALPKPNNMLLGMRPALAIHNMVREPGKDSGFRHWLKYRVGKKPVLFDQVDPRKNLQAMEGYLFNQGHFEVQGNYEIDERKKTAGIRYHLHPGPVYRIDTLLLPNIADKLTEEIQSIGTDPYLLENPAYELDKLTIELQRISDELKNRGYYNFSPDDLIFRVDSSVLHKTVRLYLEIKPGTPARVQKTSRVSTITVYDDFSVLNYRPDTTWYDRLQYISQHHAVRPDKLLRYIYLKQDQLYSQATTQKTLKLLNRLDYFRSANIRYSEIDSAGRLLHGYVYLRPKKDLSLSAEISTVAKSNNFAGPGARVRITKRNVFGGLESLSLNLSGRFETQVAGENQGNTAFEINSDLTLSIPRLVPFNFAQKDPSYIPFTKIQTGGGIFQRTRLYQFNTSYTSLAYQWQSAGFLQHNLKLPDISYTTLANSSDEFDDFLNQNPSLRRSFEEQFIIGPSYYVSIDRLARIHPTRYFLGVGIESSGSLPVLVMSMFRSEPPSPENPYKLLNNSISQFVRLRTENRFHIPIGRESTLATRIIGGVGIPFVNSNTMPYVKQFFVGGTNSLRGFAARSVGPGTYNPPEEQASLLVDQTGEIRIEANAEYRFPIKGMLKGAAFLDAGNVWLVNEDTARAGGRFSVDSFIKEMAVSTGLGLRIDVDLLVVRFDLGMPLRKPWLPEGERWVIRDIDFADRDWRRRNLIMNISIGYPF